MNGLRGSRRRALQAALGLAVAGGTTAAAAETACAQGAMPPPGARRSTDAAANVRLLGKLQGDLSGAVTWTYNPGMVYGVVPGQGLPPGEFGRALYRVEGVTQRISRLLTDGSVEERSRNWMFYCDADSGEYLTQWRNPYTGELLEVPRWRGSPSASTLTVAGPKVDFGAGLENTSLGRPPWLDIRSIGGTSWVGRHAASRLRDAAGRARNELSIDAWVCRTRDLEDPRLTHIPSTYTWTSHAEWQGWTAMQGRPGHVLWRIESVVLRERAALPTKFLARLEEVVPGQTDEPLSFGA